MIINDAASMTAAVERIVAPCIQRPGGASDAVHAAAVGGVVADVAAMLRLRRLAIDRDYLAAVNALADEAAEDPAVQFHVGPRVAG